MQQMRFVFTLLMLTLTLSKVQSQQLSIIAREKQNDSSYYDILKVADSKVWLCGKWGLLEELDSNFQIHSIALPQKGFNLLKMANWGNQILICGDQGSLYLFNKSTNQFTLKQVEGYSDYCFYNALIVSDSIAYICGGKSKIAYGKRTIPKGFVLESLDAGATWKQVYYSPFEMIWDLSIQNGTKQIECLMYSIFNKSSVRQFDLDFNPHTVFKQKGLFHEMNESKTGTLLCGGQQDFTNKSGKIKWMNGVEYLFPKNGLVWSAKFINGNFITAKI